VGFVGEQNLLKIAVMSHISSAPSFNATTEVPIKHCWSNNWAKLEGGERPPNIWLQKR